MRPLARIAIWPILLLVVALLVAYFVLSSIFGPRSATPASPPASPGAPTAAPASPQNVTGSWAGTLVQPGAPISSYTFSMSLNQGAGGAVTGTAHVGVPGQSQDYLDEQVSGQLSGSVFTFQRGNILGSGPPGQPWCVDAGQLTLSTDGRSMTGTWQGRGCGSGSITVTRQS
jgi:hypothetical protein